MGIKNQGRLKEAAFFIYTDLISVLKSPFENIVMAYGLSAAHVIH